MADEPDLSELELVNVRKQAIDRTIPLTATKASKARGRYNGAVIRFREGGSERRPIAIEARACNDGVAFRYVLPGGRPIAIPGGKPAFA